MKFTELKQDVRGGARNIYLLEGEDAYFRLKGAETIEKEFLEFPELNLTVFDGESMRGGEISRLIAALENYPFMAAKRIVKISEFYPSESDFAKLKPTFDNFPPSAILMILNSGAKKGVDLKRKHGVTYVDCGKADEETVAKWVYITFKRAGIAAQAAACTAIARYCLCDMARVSVEVEKLIDYKISGELTAEEVEGLVFKDAEYRLYEMTNAIAYRDYDKFNRVLNELCVKNGDETGVLSGLFTYLKNLLMCLESGESAAQLASSLGMKEYAVTKNREQARRIGAVALRGYLAAVYEAVSGIKGGLITPPAALQKVKCTLFFGYM